MMRGVPAAALAIGVTFAIGMAIGAGLHARLAPSLPVRVDTLVQERVRLDTAYRADTVRLWRAKTVYDTARVTDTLIRGDTVFVPRDVADEAINACMASVLTCEARVANAQASERVAWDSVSRIPAPVDGTKVALGWALIGALLALLLAR